MPLSSLRNARRTRFCSFLHIRFSARLYRRWSLHNSGYRSVNTLLLESFPIELACFSVLPAFSAAMSARANITCASAKDAAMATLAEPPPSTAGTTGITTFIKQELVADGGLPPLVRPPGMGFKRKNAGKKGGKRGRSFDAVFQATVLGHAPTAEVSRALRVLQHAGVMVIKCQQRVVTNSNQLTTQIDAVGMMLARPYTIVCIELKTCQLHSRDYPQYALSACRRTPMLRCQLPNTEQNRHCLQAAYGAMALSATFGTSPKAFVLVSCADKPLLHVVSPTFFSPILYARLTPVTTVKKPTIKAKKEFPNLATLMAAWPSSGDNVLAKCHLHRRRKQAGRRVWAASNTVGGPVSALVIHVPRWRALRANQRMGFVAKLRRVAGTAAEPGTAVSIYVLATFIPGQNPTLLPVAAPFVRR